MKKYWILVLSIVFIYVETFAVNAVEFDLNSKNVILYNLDENEVLYEKDSKEKIAIASMTKIMTAIVAIEHIDNLDETVTLTWADSSGLVEANASVAGFKYGQKLTYRDLLYGLLLPSGADAAQALTRTVAGGRDPFVQMMNEKAKELNLENTHFVNETGLDEDGHYSTVEEVAKLFQYALQNEEFQKIITASSYTMSDNSFTVYSTIQKTKRRYGIDLDYVQGGKTGTTYNAGLCLASIATSNNVHYMLVTARAPYNEGPKNFYDAKTVYEYFINHYGNQLVVEKGEKILTLDTQYTKEDSVSFYIENSYQKYLPNEFKKEDLKYEYDGEKIITSKMESGTKLGKLSVKYQDEILYEQDIILKEKLSFDFMKYLKAHIELVVGGIGIVVIILVFIFIVIRKHRRKRKAMKQAKLRDSRS